MVSVVSILQSCIILSLAVETNQKDQTIHGVAIQSLPVQYDGTVQLMQANIIQLEGFNAALIRQLSKEKEKMAHERRILNFQVISLLQQIQFANQEIDRLRGNNVRNTNNTDPVQSRDTKMLNPEAPNWRPQKPVSPTVVTNSLPPSRFQSSHVPVERVNV